MPERARAEAVSRQASLFEQIVGVSAPLRSVLSQVSKVGPDRFDGLITGETGTGKELVARAIHKLSQRSAGALVSVDCAAIPSSLIASELFGHEKGSLYRGRAAPAICCRGVLEAARGRHFLRTRLSSPAKHDRDAPPAHRESLAVIEAVDRFRAAEGGRP